MGWKTIYFCFFIKPILKSSYKQSLKMQHHKEKLLMSSIHHLSNLIFKIHLKKITGLNFIYHLFCKYSKFWVKENKTLMTYYLFQRYSWSSTIWIIAWSLIKESLGMSQSPQLLDASCSCFALYLVTDFLLVFIFLNILIKHFFE